MKHKKSKDVVIYKQDIMDDDGKLNFFGTFLVVGVVMACLNKAFEMLSDSIVDKDKVC